MMGKREVIDSSVGLVPTNAHVFTDTLSLRRKVVLSVHLAPNFFIAVNVDTTVAQTVVGGLNGSNNPCSPKGNGSLGSLREVS